MLKDKWKWLTRDEGQGWMLWHGKPVFNTEFCEWEYAGDTGEWCNDDVVQVPCEEGEDKECIWQRDCGYWIRPEEEEG